MNRTRSIGCILASTLTIGSAAFGAEQNIDVLSQIAELKAEIASLKSNSGGDQWLTEQRASEIRGIVTDVLADADTRSSLQGSGAGSGYNGGFFLSSADGNYSMKVNVLEQIRWTYNDRSGSPDGNTNNWGFENKRTRMSWSGNIVDSSWTYKVAYYFAYANDVEFNSGGAVLADAFVKKDLGNGLSLTVGQFKLPFSGEYGVDAGNLQFNDYSTVSNMFSDNYGQGVMIGYAADAFQASAAYVNALDETNDQFSNETPDTEYAFSGRAAIKIQGNWDQFNNAQSFKGEEMGVLIGAGFSCEEANANDSSVYSLTGDVTIDFGGANLMAAYFWDNLDDGVATFNPYGFTVQGGVFVTDDCEIVARYEFGSLDTGSTGEFSALTFGANWYMAQNTAKFGANFGYAFDEVTEVWYEFGAQGNNWLADAAGEDGQWMIQGQLSFSF
jgi:hypothetical protein